MQEEDCDGLCWQYLIEQGNIRPEFVISTEPTDCQIYRGHRGRMEIRVDVQGRSCHGSAPERGDNAIFKMAPILIELQGLAKNLGDDEFLGKGTLTVSEIFFTSPSRCAVADSCAISIDRRLTWGETWERALDEIRALPAVKAANAVVSMYHYERPSYTGLVYPTECFFPTWKTPEDHVTVRTLAHGLRGPVQEQAGDRQVDLLDQRRVHHGPPRHPGGRLRPRQGAARRTRPTRRPGRSTWSSAPPCMPPCR